MSALLYRFDGGGLPRASRGIEFAAIPETARRQDARDLGDAPVACEQLVNRSLCILDARTGLISAHRLRCDCKGDLTAHRLRQLRRDALRRADELLFVQFRVFAN